MNVYVRNLAAGLAHTGSEVSVYVRRWSDSLPREVVVEPGVRVVHVDAGPSSLCKEELPEIVDEYTESVLLDIRRTGGSDIIHANYWLSGVAGHRVKHELSLPLVTTFHTLARAKAETGDSEPERRVVAETDVIHCSDVVVANSPAEAQQLQHYYDAPADRIAVVPPGTDHALFSPGDQAAARRALNLGVGPVILFVGRIQPLKGIDVAIETFAALGRSDATLMIVGGASGADGVSEVDRVRGRVESLGLHNQVRFVSPLAHHLLSTYYRAADLVLAPSRSESFGLVALEAAACGTPVIAAAVGGLSTLIDHGRTGFLVDGRDPAVYAGYARRILDDPLIAAEMAMSTAEHSRRYTWGAMSRKFCSLFTLLSDRQLVAC